MKNRRISFLLLGIGIAISSCGEKKFSETSTTTDVESNFTEFVDPFIGTGGHGHTFPGATVPYGMVQLSPDTRTEGWDASSGYHYSDSTILGFSHTHLSGTGIGDYGDVLFMPFTGEAKTEPGTPDDPDSGYRSRFSHSDEKASPGYYSVQLSDYNIKAELTASIRSGFHRYTFPADERSGVVIDLSHTIHEHHNPVNEIRVISDTEIEGYKRTQGWAQNHHVYFYAKFNKPFSYKLYEDGNEHQGASSINTTNSQAVLHFDDSNEKPLMVKVGISPVDYEGAKKNVSSEIEDWDFDAVRKAANVKWEEQLGKIEVSGGSEDQKKIFYTGLYHSSISPNIFSDVDGRYRGMDQEIHRSEEPVYTVFSLWDTFRAFHPLLTIIDPDRNTQFINSLLTKYDEGGVLPKWELAANYTGTMTGYHAIPVIYDAYKKGSRDFDVEKAYEAMVHSSQYDTTGIHFPSEEVKEKVMPMAKLYNETLGFIPADKENESVSKALEYAYNDWCIAQMAKDLGKTADYEKYMERSRRYKKYFDKGTGFMRGLKEDGTWREPFNPRFSRHRMDDYTEGNAWQWTWFVPHDVEGLVDLMGGQETFRVKLDSLFSITSEIEGEERSADITGLIGQYAHGNEPSHHITHMYNFVEQPWKTQKLTDSIMTSLYFNDPNGLSGNEDAGQMSAWYILNAMGFYSFLPGSGEYSIGRPIFDEVIVNLDNGEKFTVRAHNNSSENLFIQRVRLNGEVLNTPFFDHEEIMEGGELEFEMGSEPNRNWGIE